MASASPSKFNLAKKRKRVMARGGKDKIQEAKEMTYFKGDQRHIARRGGKRNSQSGMIG